MLKHSNCVNYMHCMKGELVVLLENCLKDVPTSDQNITKGCKQDLSSSISTDEQLLPRTLQTTNVEFIPDPIVQFIPDPIVRFIPDPISSNDEDCVLCSDKIEPTTQTLNQAESLLLDLPIPNTIDKVVVKKSGMIADDSLLGWEKLAEPLVCEVKTPLSSGNSSIVDLDLTPPSSVASKRSLFEDTSCEDGFLLDFDMLPDETAKADVDKKVLTENICNKLCVEIVRFEPTLCQLQALYRRNEASGTATHNTCRKRFLRPKNSLKQFVPFMFEQAEYMKKRNKTRRSPKIFHSTPKVNDTDSANKNTKGQKVKKGACIGRKFEKKQLKIALKRKKAIEIRQLKLTLKQKEAFEKKQQKLVLSQKKETSKHRNKFENALDSINRRICNQNSFWRTLPR